MKTVAVGIDGAETRRMAQDERTTRREVRGDAAAVTQRRGVAREAADDGFSERTY